MTDTQWMLDAACRGEDFADLFHPKGTNDTWAPLIADAKRTCAACPVRRACLDYAMNDYSLSGIWGGLTEEERATLRRRNAKRRARAKGTADVAQLDAVG